MGRISISPRDAPLWEAQPFHRWRGVCAAQMWERRLGATGTVLTERSRRRGAPTALALVLALCACSAQAALPTVVSTDLCSDLLLLKIAAPEQILSVSRQSQDPQVSPVAEQARRYPANRGSVEDLLHLKPDIALVYFGWTARRHADLLATQGIRAISAPYPRNWQDSLAAVREIAAQIGRKSVGEAKAAEAERRMRALAERQRPYRMLYLRPNGGTAGQGTYVDDVITRLGLQNLAREQGLSGWGRFPLEQLITSPPDVFLLGYFDRSRSKTGSAYGRHPLFRTLLARTPNIRIPGNAWGCGGLELIGAAEQIAAHLDRLPLGAAADLGD